MGSTLLTSQVLGLISQGHSIEEIAGALDLLPEAVEIMVRGSKKEDFGELKQIALEALKEVAKYSVDNPGARVAACKVILDESARGQEVTFDYDKLASLISNSRERVIECETRVLSETSEIRELEFA